MTWRSNTTATIGEWITSRYDGLGVPASDIPSSGDNGAGYLFNDIAAQGAVPTDEFRGVILTSPSVGTFITNENSSFSFTDAPAGTYTATYRGFRNGVTYGDYTITLIIGGNDRVMSIVSELPSLSSTASITVSNPVRNIVINAPLPSLTSDVGITTGVPTFNVGVDTSLPLLQSSLGLTYQLPLFNITLTTSLPSLTSQMTVSNDGVMSDSDIVIVSTLPPLNSGMNIRTGEGSYQVFSGNLVYIKINSNKVTIN